MIWDIPEIIDETIEDFAKKFSCDPLMASVFLSRGVTEPEQLRFFLDTDLKNLHNPFLFHDMTDAIDRLHLAKDEGEKVLVFGDRDVDGITATALMVSRLEEFGIDVVWKIPMGDDQYGLSESVVQEYANQDVTLIVAVDCGITSVKEIDIALSLGIDTIIIDHHEPQDVIPEALAIINPKVDDSGYPFAGLCAAGLVGKVLWALDFSLTEMYKQRFTLLHVRPGNESVIFEAVKLENLVEVDRLMETLVPGIVSPEKSRLVPFLQNEMLFLYNKEKQMRLMKQVFGETVDIGVTDLEPEIVKQFPSLKDVSLLRMLQGSKLARFSHKMPPEIDGFSQLVISYLLAKHPELQTRLVANLDLVCLGTVADMMPLTNENRILVYHGLKSLEKTHRPGLIELLARVKLLGKPLAPMDIGWKIGPVINSTGRMGNPSVSVELLLAKEPDTGEVQALVNQIQQMNEERKNLGQEAWERVYPLARESLEIHQNKFLLVRDDSVHRGITGILAGRLCRDFRAPATVVAFLDNRAVGSIRTIGNFSATTFLSQFEDLFENWGGHHAAGGFSLPAEKFSVFQERIPQVLEYLPQDEQEEEKLRVDVQVPHDRMTPDLEQIDLLLQPQGQEFPRIQYMVSKAKIEDIQFMGKAQEHVKITLSTGKHRWPAVYWNASNRVEKDFKKLSMVDVVFHLERNYWGAQSTLQLQIIDLRLS
jgi:single-stranded-DNA-specific exonuclease